MKRTLFAVALAALALSAHAGDDSPAVRHAYYVTLRDPSQCSKLFP